MDKSDDAPLSRSEFVKILLSTPSNCELRCQVLKVFQTFRDSKCMFNVTVLRCMQNITRYFSIYIYLYLYLFQLMLICLLAFYRALHRLQVFCSCSDWFVALSGSVMIFFFSASYPGQFALSGLPEAAWNLARILGEFSRQVWQVASHPKSQRTTGNEAAFFFIFLLVSFNSLT